MYTLNIYFRFIMPLWYDHKEIEKEMRKELYVYSKSKTAWDHFNL